MWSQVIKLFRFFFCFFHNIGYENFPNSVNKAWLAGGRAFIQEEWMFWAGRWTVLIQNSLTVFYCFLAMESEKSKASSPLDSPEDWQNNQSPIDFRYYNVKWWLYWKRISDLSSRLGVISTKLLSLITSNTYYQCQGIFVCASFKSGCREPTVLCLTHNETWKKIYGW